MKGVLYIIGGVLCWFTRLYHKALRTYITENYNRKNNSSIKYIGPNTKVFGNVHIGENSYVNGGELIAAKDSHIWIGNDCMISYGVVMRTEMHNHERTDIPMIEQGGKVKDIHIEDDVWIGYGAYIMPGVTIHKGSIIGAHAVVTKDISAYSVAVGVPAKVIKSR